MTWLLAKIKAYAYLGLGLLGTVLSFLLMNERRKHWKRKADDYKTRAHRQRVIAEKDIEIEEQTESRRANARREIEAGDAPADFRDPNRLFKRKDD